MGASVPVPVTIVAGAPGSGPVQFRDIGTNIDASGRPLGDGRFTVSISVSDNSVVPNPQDTLKSGVPVIRTFSSSNNLVMRDGQTRQFTAASVRVTGEVVKVEVTLKIVK